MNKFRFSFSSSSSSFLLLFLFSFFTLVPSFINAQIERQPLPPPKITSSPPTEHVSPILTAAPKIVVQAPVYVRQKGVYEKDSFPSDAPQRKKIGDAPLPISSPGRYLHTSVIIKNKMYVYGGISTYDHKYFNDLWLYSVGDDVWNELQGSYVPPLPKGANLGLDGNSTFKPNDVPSAPALKTSPLSDNKIAEDLNPERMGSNPLLPRFKAQRPVRIYHLPPIDAEKLTPQQAADAVARGLVRDGQTTFVELDSETHLSLSNQNRNNNRFKKKSSLATANRLASKLRMKQQLRNDGGEEAPAAGAETSANPTATPTARDGPPDVASLSTRAGSYYAQPFPAPPSSTHSVAPGAETHLPVHPDVAKNLPPVPHDFWMYDVDSKEWSVVDVETSKPNSHSPWLSPQTLNDPIFKSPNPVLLPPSRRLHSAVVMREKMVVFGGVAYNNIILADLWVYDPDTKTWTEANPDVKNQAASPIMPREGHTAVVGKSGLDMYVFGGVSYGFMPFNDLWCYNAADNVWKRLLHHTGANEKVPVARWLHTSIYDKKTDSMIVFGGVTSGHVPLNDVWKLNLESLSWESIKTTGIPPFPRMMHTAVLMKRQMFVQGGAANNLPMDDMWVLDVDTFQWRELMPNGPYPFARVGATSVLLSPAYATIAAIDPANADYHATADSLKGNPLDPNADDPDISDPHLDWKPDLAAIEAKPVVASFSSEGVNDGEANPGNTQGLEQIADPQNTASAKNGIPVRPLFRYRKHPINNFWILTFGGATATQTDDNKSSSKQQSNQHKQQKQYSSRNNGNNNAIQTNNKGPYFTPITPPPNQFAPVVPTTNSAFPPSMQNPSSVPAYMPNGVPVLNQPVGYPYAQLPRMFPSSSSQSQPIHFPVETNFPVDQVLKHPLPDGVWPQVVQQQYRQQQIENTERRELEGYMAQALVMEEREKQQQLQQQQLQQQNLQFLNKVFTPKF